MKTLYRNANAVESSPIEQATFQFATGIVSAAEHDHFMVVSSVPLRAQRAASCNCIPHVGDTVLFARSDSDAWIIAVLVSQGTRPMDLTGTQVRISAEEIQMQSTLLNTTSADWKANHGEITLSASGFRACVGAMDWVGNKLTSLIDLCLSRQRRLMREVSEIETVKCGTYSLQADNAMALTAQTSLVTAKGLMKFNAEQIHIG